MPEIRHLPVKVHTCAAEMGQVPYAAILAGNRYIREGEEDLEVEKTWYTKLRTRCRCRLWISLYDADWFIRRGEAFRIMKKKRKKLVEDEFQIWKPGIRLASKINRVPRIDLITSRDIEGAYIEGNWKFVRYIEEVHDMLSKGLQDLMVPFRPDPFEGRVLFPFALDERTPGGHV
jgi:hypothetical protein